MEHATLIDEWLEEAVQEAVQEAEKKASYEGRLEQAIRSIILILTIRFKITDVQEESFLIRLKQITDITALNALEEDALRAFNLDSFNAALNNLQTHPNSGSVQ